MPNNHPSHKPERNTATNTTAPNTPVNSMHRRTFIKATTPLLLLPAVPYLRTSATAANDKVNLACVGIGAQGGNIARAIGGISSVNVVALCDVEIGHGRTKRTLEAFPNAKRFHDFRKMLEEMDSEIDALTIGTADHSHFPIAMLAMSMGKHVYIEKPLANTFLESELLMAAEKKFKVNAQVGNQGHSGSNYHQFKTWTEEGVIKDVTEVIAFMNSRRRWHGWDVDGFPEAQDKPDELDWDLWLATAQPVPFHGRLHPGNWRSWYRFGNGAFGDWGPHILDTAHRFLELGLPNEIEAVKLEGPNEYIFPQASTIKFSFPARGDKPPVVVTWYDGTQNKPTPPPEFSGNLPNNGKFIISKELTFSGGTHGDILRIIPDEKRVELTPDLPRFPSGSNHYDNFIRAVQGSEKCRSSLDVGGPLNQVFNLGTIAQELGGKLTFDRETKQFTNNDTANQLLHGPPPREGWEQYYNL